jgi:hypothetical protein
MRTERQTIGKTWLIGLLLLSLLVQTRISASGKHTRRTHVRSRKLNDDESDDVRETKNEEEEEEEEEEEVKSDHVKNIYETKMIEFEDEIEGMTYLDAIEWEDRYWLDFYNLMNTVKGRLLERIGLNSR